VYVVFATAPNNEPDENEHKTKKVSEYFTIIKK
jgi:hypothetical protein